MCRAAPACRRPISPSGNCPNWYRRRFSWPVPTRAADQQAEAILSTASSGVRLTQLRSELVAYAGAHVVRTEGHVLDRQEFDILPLGAHEHIAPKHVFASETGGPARHEAIGPVFRRSGVSIGAQEIPLVDSDGG